MVARLAKTLRTSSKELKKIKDAADKVKKGKAKPATQKGLKLSKRKDIRMPETSPKSADIRTVTGTKGVTARGEVINVGDDALGFSNFLALQKSKGILKREQAKRALEKIIDEGTPNQKKEASVMLEKMKQKSTTSDIEATGKQQRGRRGKSTKTIAKSDDSFFKALDLAKKDGILGEDYDKLLPNQKKQIEQAAKAFQKSKFRKETEAMIAEPKSAPKSTGSAVENKRRIGINDYRKGGYVLSTVDNRKKRK